MPARRKHDTDPDAALLRAEIVRLREIIERRSIYPPFGCYTRAALDDALRDQMLDNYGIAFFDLDEMKRHNTERGKQAVNASIRYAITLREHDIATVGLWFSGDEFVILAPASDIRGLCERIQRRFLECGMSATFAYTDLLDGDDINNVVSALDTFVQQMKSTNRRGDIRKV